MRAAKLHTQIRQEQIAEAALALVAAQGTEGLSVAQLARRVGVVPSAIYRHYRSKDEVFDAVLELIRRRLLANVEGVCEESIDALERLHRLLMVHVKLLLENQGIPRVVFAQELQNGNPGRKRRVYEMVGQYLGRIADIVRQGQKSGDICSDFTPDAVAMMFLGIVQPAALLWSLSDGDFNVADHAERAWRVLDAAIRPSQLPGPVRRPKRKEKS